MPLYPAPPNPYRASTGSVPAPVPILRTTNGRNAVTGHYVDQCSSCGSSYSDENTLPLNTPYSAQPTLAPNPRDGSRRTSNSAETRPVIISENRPTPTSFPPPGQVLHRYQNGALVYEPASSISHGRDRRERRNSVSSSQPRTYHQPNLKNRHPRRHKHAPAGEWQSYQHEIDIREEKHGKRGKTKIPRRLVNKEAIQESGLSWEEEKGTGVIIIFKALSRHDVEKLVKRTEAIRARRREKGEKVVRIIEPPKATIIHHTSGHGQDVRRTEETRKAEERIIRAEERAQEAHERARKKEYRAEVTGSFVDGIKARKARAEAEQMSREAEDVIIKERRREEKSYGSGTTVKKVSKTPREVVIVR